MIFKGKYLPNTKTIFELSNIESRNEESCKLAEEIIKISHTVISIGIDK